MVFLPCPRLRRARPRLSESDDGSSLAYDSDCTIPEGLPPLPEAELHQNRQAFAGFFPPQTARSDACPSGSRTGVSRPVNPRYKGITPKKSRASLISLSGRLRRKLSRDTRSSKKSRGPITPQHEVRDSDIFRTGRADEGGYDSDARHIQIPKITQAQGGSPSTRITETTQESPDSDSASAGASALVEIRDEIVKQNIIPERAQVTPEDADPTPKPSTAAHGDLTRTSTPETQSSTIDNAVYNTPSGSYIGDQAFFTPRQSQSPPGCSGGFNVKPSGAHSREVSSLQSQKDDHTVSPTLAKDALDGTPAADYATTSVDGLPDGRPNYKEDGEPEGICTPPSPPHNPLIRATLATEETHLAGPVRPSRTASGYWSQSVYSDPRSSFNISTPPCLSQTWQQREDSNASQDATLQACSLSDMAASAHNAGGETASIQEGSGSSQKVDEANTKRSKFTLLHGKSSLIPKPLRGSQVDVHGSMRISHPSTGSKFVENFNDSVSTVGLENGRRRGSDGWLSGGKRIGYGYNFVANLEAGSASDTAAARTDEVGSEEQQHISHSAGSMNQEEPGSGEVVDDGNSPTDNPSTRARNSVSTLEAKISHVRRSLSIVSLAKSQRSATTKDGDSLGAVAEDRKAQNVLKGKDQATPVPENDIPPEVGRKRGLLKPWARPSQSSNTIVVTKRNGTRLRQMKAAGNEQRDECRHGTSRSTCSGCHDTLRELSESKKNVRDFSPKAGPISQNSYPPPSELSSPRPAPFDGPFDVQSQRITSGGSSTDATDRGNAGYLIGEKSAENWSRMYQDCLPHLSMSEETVISTAGNDQRTTSNARRAS